MENNKIIITDNLEISLSIIKKLSSTNSTHELYVYDE